MESINFHIGGLFEKEFIIDILLPIYKNERDKFRDNVVIKSLYGSVSCPWNGGRIVKHGTKYDVKSVAERMAQEYPDISCRLTFTNIYIKEEDLSDPMGNLMLDCFHKINNSIIIYSPLLERYIRDKYPQYQFVSSITKCLSEEDTQKELYNENYDIVVLNSNFVKDFDFLKRLHQREKLEVLVNDACGFKCPNRLYHYQAYSRCQKEGGHPFRCPYDNGPGPFFVTMKKSLFVSNEDIRKYLDMGINNFKIQGRNDYDYDLVETLVYYLIKPEYQIEIRERLMLYNKF